MTFLLNLAQVVSNPVSSDFMSFASECRIHELFYLTLQNKAFIDETSSVNWYYNGCASAGSSWLEHLKAKKNHQLSIFEHIFWIKLSNFNWPFLILNINIICDLTSNSKVLGSIQEQIGSDQNLWCLDQIIEFWRKVKGLNFTPHRRVFSNFIVVIT